MICWKVSHKNKLIDHIERKDIGIYSSVILEFLHKTDLCLLLHRFMSRSVFSYAESIMRPDELDWKFHQSSHTDSRLHII